MSDLKIEALLACAEAYAERGPWVQYDQLSMDRLLRISPRRRIFLPPEAGTEQEPLYLDCSGFIHAAFYSTFGYELPAKLTWHMIEQVKPRLYYYELTHGESEEELERIKAEVRALLKPGDVVTYEVEGNGHTMLIVNENEYIHCSGRGRRSGYNYQTDRDDVLPYDAVGKDAVIDYFRPADENERRYLFSKKVKRFAVCRPLEAVGDPTPEALARLKLRGLRFSVLSSHPGARQAEYGETVRFTVRTDNLSDRSRTLTLRILPPEGTKLLSDAAVSVSAAPGETVRTDFALQTAPGAGPVSLTPQIFADDLPLYTPEVLLRRSAPQPDAAALSEEYLRLLAEGADCFAALTGAFGKQGIPFSLTRRDLSARYFFPFDAACADVLYRRPADPDRDASVPRFFGGKGVITPEMGPGSGMRCTRLLLRDLEPGDVLLVSNDSYGRAAYACLFDGRMLAGCSEAGAEPHLFTEEETVRFLDSLFGRFAFILLRPKQLQ